MFNETEVADWVGYLWRYAGNGGGMGISFLFLLKYIPGKSRIFNIGIIYGLFIFSTLTLTLLLVPGTEEFMFKVTPVTFTGSLIGHVIYGAVLGFSLSESTRIKREKFVLINLSLAHA